MAVQNQNDAHMAVQKSCIQSTSEVLTVNWLHSQHTPFKPCLLCCSMHVRQNPNVEAACSATGMCSHFPPPKFLQSNTELQVCTSMCSQNKPGVRCCELRPLFITLCWEQTEQN